MTKPNYTRWLMIVALGCVFSGCTVHREVRGVSDVTWHQLGGEQKQLIVDQSYQQFMQQPATDKTKAQSAKA